VVELGRGFPDRALSEASEEALLVVRGTQDDCPSISVSRMRALGEVTEGMGSVHVAIAGVEREVRLSHLHFPNGGGWSFFLCPVCGRRARVLKLFERIACWRCTGSGFPPRRLLYRVQLGDRAERIGRLRQRLCGDPARVKPRPGRTLDRRWRTEQALRRALIAERSRVKGARDALAKERPDDSGQLR
jgi:hypothetical protein